MNREKAMQKVRKLLKLAGSSNPNEAAAAMRQAQAMMRQFAISESEVGEVVERFQKTRGCPPVYIVALGKMLGDAFGCHMIGRSYPHGLVFIGLAGHAEMAEYGFTVLRRQLESDRRQHLSRVKLPKNRAARGDRFGLSWVAAVQNLVERYADGIDPRVEQYMSKQYPALKSVNIKARSGASRNADHDAHAGYAAGKSARLARGMDGSSQRQLSGVIAGAVSP